ncbi:unnamed protein product [Mytilus edulis]|uniref:Endonuclease/exonuclease/phosphatase domain-containing protein n=1 Tax=Mytilus edulis TaxID=6550 RepID=A0A8S3QYH3_MYTED|nr:unnamed protein product [Mytilus edulis]
MFNSMCRKKPIWEDISKQLKIKGIDRTGKQCEVRIHTMTTKYRKIVKANKESGASPKFCPFFEQLDEVLGTKATFGVNTALICNINADIVSVCETHLSGTNELDLAEDGYKWYGSNRTFIHRNAPKASGGVGFLVKHSILKSFDVRIIDKSVDGILGLLFRNKETDFTCVAFSCYLPPENSPWGRDAQTFYSHVLSQIYLNYDVDAIFLLGDFNSRLGNLKDVSTEFDNVTTRETIDKTHNQHGQSFSEFLNDSKFCVLNGRSGEQSNKFTSISLEVGHLETYQPYHIR